MRYLNTAPLIAGLLPAAQHPEVELRLETPSVCAQEVAAGRAHLGLNPVMEIFRQGWSSFFDTGIACRGPVRSILVISRRPFQQIRSLAVDTGSRTSVQLSRIILTRRFGVDPVLLPMAPALEPMLEAADAALLIGDAALAVDPAEINHPSLDLGAEWIDLTGLPMVFALWSGPPANCTPPLRRLLLQSAHTGLAQLDAIIARESALRGFPEWLVHQYLTRHIHFLLDNIDKEGLERFRQLSGELPAPRFDTTLESLAR